MTPTEPTAGRAGVILALRSLLPPAIEGVRTYWAEAADLLEADATTIQALRDKNHDMARERDLAKHNERMLEVEIEERKRMHAETLAATIEDHARSNHALAERIRVLEAALEVIGEDHCSGSGWCGETARAALRLGARGEEGGMPKGPITGHALDALQLIAELHDIVSYHREMERAARTKMASVWHHEHGDTARQAAAMIETLADRVAALEAALHPDAPGERGRA